jgi:hypothetical protein
MSHSGIQFGKARNASFCNDGDEHFDPIRALLLKLFLLNLETEKFIVPKYAK